jgi:acetyl esterase/lipase
MKYLFASLLLSLLLSFPSLQAQSPALMTWQDLQKVPTPAPGQRIPYGPDSLQFGELRVPVGKGPFPVVVVVHGGCWLNQFSYGYMNHLSAALTKAGYATWNIEFRRVGDVGGGWPGTFLDVAKAVDHVRELAKAHPVSKTEVAVIGHSAGGHLALWAAGRQNIPRNSDVYTRNPLKVKGVVSLAGITDLAAYSAEQGRCNTAVAKLMGGTPDAVPQRYKAGSPRQLTPLKVPVRLVQGVRDPIVPISQAESFGHYSFPKEDASRWLVLLPQAGHFDLVAPPSPVWPSVEQAVRDVLKTCRK